MTTRADGQFNTTIYNEDDRFRGIYGSRDVVLMNADDIAELGIAQGDLVTLSTEANDGVERRLGGLQVVPYDVPRKGIVGYYPECNVLVPLWHLPRAAKCRPRNRFRCGSPATPAPQDNAQTPAIEMLIH